MFAQLGVEYNLQLGWVFPCLQKIINDIFVNNECIVVWVDTKEHNNINISVSVQDVDIYLSTENKIEYQINDKYLLDVKVLNNTIEITNSEKPLSYLSIFNLGDLKVKMYLTKDTLNSLIVNSFTLDSLTTYDDIDSNAPL